MAARPATYRLMRQHVDGSEVIEAGAWSANALDPTGQTINVGIGDDAGAAGKLGTHDFWGHRLINGLPAGLSDDDIDGLMRAEAHILARDAVSTTRAAARPELGFDA